MNIPHCRLFRRFSRLGLGSLLAAASFTAFGQVNVLTQHNDISRTGANTQETILTTANVNQTQFGKIFTESVDGQVYAQPLYVSALGIAGGTHNVVYVCTEHNSVYAFDANIGGAPLWHVNLGPSDTNQGCTDITVEYGISSTPVIDMSTNTIYIDSKTLVGGNFFQTLHALDLSTGAEKFGAPVTIAATVRGVTFNANLQHQRPGLLLLNGVVYLGFASHCDNGAYHGWLLGYSAGPSTIAQTTAFCTTPTGTDGGIWSCGMAPSADANGFIYVITGNGSWDGTANFGDSFIKFNTAGGLSVADYFTPHNQAALSSADLDLGSGGAVLLPSHYVVGMAKSGSMYLCDTNNMGKFNANTDSCLQVFSATAESDTVSSSPVYWNGPSKQYLFIASGNDTARSYQFTGTSVNTTALGNGSVADGQNPGGSSLSSNGTANGIFWTISESNALYAYDAVNFPTVLWASSQNAGRDGLGAYVKFATPTIANGMVYVGTSNQLVAYGLLPPQAAAPVFSPGGGTYGGAQSVTISDATSGASIRYTLDGSTPSETAGTLYTGAVTINNTVTLKAIAYLSGDTDSTITSATYTIPGVEGPFGGTPAGIPGTVQAENYDTGAQGVGYNVTTVNGTDNGYRSDGVDLEVTTDTGGGASLGWTAAGQWFKYTVNVATAGTYTVSFRVAAMAAVTGAFHLADSSGTNLSGPVNVPATGGWQIWTTVTANVTLPAGQQVLTLDEDNAGWNINYMSFAASGGTTFTITASAGSGGSISPTGAVVVNQGANQAFTISPNAGFNVSSVTVDGVNQGAITSFTFTNVQANHTISAAFQQQSSGEGPFGGTPAGIPGTVQAENYDTGGQGVGYNVTAVNGNDNGYRSDGVDLEVSTDTGGGVDLGWSAAGQWFRYTVNVATAGTYTVSFRVADPAAVADAFHLANSSGTNLSGSVNLPGTGGWQTWATVTASVTLPAGQQVLTLDEDNAGWNINYMSFAASGGGTVAAPSFSPAAGTYSGAQNVTITSATSGASIRYTTDGSTPSETAGTLYSAPVSIGATTTLQAIAYETGLTDSAITSGTYTITTSGAITLQATNLTTTGSGQVITPATDTAAPGGTWVKIASTAVGQWIQFTTPSIPAGTYSLSFVCRTAPTRAQHNVTIDGTQVGTTVDQYAAISGYPTVAIGSVTFGTTGTHTIRLTATGKNAASSDFQISAAQFIFQ